MPEKCMRNQSGKLPVNVSLKYICGMRPMFTFVLFCLFVTVPSFQVVAQTARPIRQPEAILVLLPSQQNRLRVLQRSGDKKREEQLTKDLQKIYIAIRNDFRDHFSFCPVYYFMDTNIALVKQHRFKGIILDSNGEPVAEKKLDGRAFQIVYYGYAKARIPRIGYLAENEQADFDTRFGKVWVVCDDQLQQVAYSDLPGVLDRESEYYFDKAYRQKSKRFDIGYFPVAYKLQQTLGQMEPR